MPQQSSDGEGPHLWHGEEPLPLRRRGSPGNSDKIVFLTTLLHGLWIQNVPGQELDLSAEFGPTMSYRISISSRFQNSPKPDLVLCFYTELHYSLV
ncbi:hypothetical protein NHX12_029126 [Muraenolepis orangiensis]|uniref:Uncharacterized protein n=1 Tax=Muraenolepis orangiensis TaxID=630683 RepID=A0A9Q0EFE7_9TELE|nr:hypothetical protein NHX12_029126 [Muraenolepis orangiensis]